MRVGWVRRWWGVRSRALDVLLVLVNLLVDLGIAIDHFDKRASVGFAVVVALSVGRDLPLIVRRRHAVWVAAGAIGVDFALWVGYGIEDQALSLAALISLYSLGRFTPYRTGWTAGAVLIAAYPLASVFRETSETRSNTTMVILIVVLGQFVRLRAETTERARNARATEAVHAERRRIARELHDVVAHHITTMNVLVGAARTTMTADPERAQEALATTERTAREAMTEMRQLLTVLRADDADDGPVAGTAQLPALVARTPKAELSVGGLSRSLPAAVDLAVYRIVQEALTNTRKHAGAVRATVRLGYEPAAIEVEVLDDGGIVLDDVPEGGFGLRGMAERVTMCGGRLQAGPRPEGGFRVHARIPLDAVS